MAGPDGGGPKARTRALLRPQAHSGPPSTTCKKRWVPHVTRWSGARIHGTDFVSWRARLARLNQVAGRGGLCYGPFVTDDPNGATREMLWPGPASSSAPATLVFVWPGRDAGRAKHGDQPRVCHGLEDHRRAAGLGVWGAARAPQCERSERGVGPGRGAWAGSASESEAEAPARRHRHAPRPEP